MAALYTPSTSGEGPVARREGAQSQSPSLLWASDQAS